MSADGVPGGGSRRMVAVAAGVVAVGLLLILLHRTVEAIVTTWATSATYNHGFLIIPICLYLAWRRRDLAAAVAIAPEWRGLALIVVAAVAWLIGNAAGALVVQELCLVVLIQAVILTMYGWPLFRLLIFPLLYLFFAVPIGDAVIPPLQTLTAVSAVELLNLVGVPVFSDGNVISIPTGSFYVAEACSGVRYLIGSLAIGALFAGLMYRSWGRRVLFLLVSIVVPVAANAVRAFGIILLAYLSNNELAVGVDHIIYGWIFFSLVTFLVLGVGTTFREAEAVPVVTKTGRGNGSLVGIVLAGLLALVPVAAARGYGDFMLDMNPTAAVASRSPLEAVKLASAFPQLSGVKDALAPEFAGADAVTSAAYDVGGRKVYLHIGYYRIERRGAEVVSWRQRLIGNPHWILSEEGKAAARIGGTPTSVSSTRYVFGAQGRVIWSWYWVDGHFTANPYYAKFLQAKVKLLGGERASALIVAAADYHNLAADADRSLAQFTAQLGGLKSALSAAQPR